ncbi:murein biosynthesis integral membrane protein MurJ [Candidatus Vallotia lariciata]|uniref:murein biosynthesis integral membrane protein MurJ n=1 Tax=Candidatus Vallotia laricis TaxID=2018052 RepID=UPI001D0319C3|nr:murein biosynthesis integral membrane protein MurJ [Candidatus Vallotia lariciata]UDG82868.1 Lipid II flippase MurJ [Candidatus Vallotia lariciata]
MNLLRTLCTVTGFTLLSRITGLAREVLIARTFGACLYTDAFNVAFRIPNLLRRLSAEGAFSQAFVPILSEFKSQNGHDATRTLVDATSIVLIWVLVSLSTLGIFGSGFVVWIVASGLHNNDQVFVLAVTMTRIMFPYILLISLTALASSVLNTYRNFSLPAFSPVLLNVSFIFSALVVAPHLDTPIYALAFAVLAGGVLQLLMQLIGLKRVQMMPRIRLKLNLARALAHPGIKRVLWKMMPASFAVSVAQLSLIINTNIASHLAPGSVSWLSYADRLMEFPTALLGGALGTILLPSLSKAHVEADGAEYSALLDWGLRLTFLLAAPSAVALFFYAEPLTATLFNYGRFSGHDVAMVSHTLAAYGVGLLGLILTKILAPGFYAKQDIKTPVKIALIVIGVTQLCNVVFVPYLAHSGLALSISIGACVNALLLFTGLRQRSIYIPSVGWGTFFVQLSGACIALASAMRWFTQLFDWVALGRYSGMRITILIITLLILSTLYFVMLFLMGLKHTNFYRYAK